ncbi:SDR family oxidoreductase [Staphylococcus caprae]|uniref:SDR family oxidoreductase n=1 Tax=Staphylococcus caprae TaxID=29380 RepID=UPI0024B50CCB|nr:SDR family oxidoreductase [Staphylococcus caprae]MDI9232116.1 SDR family oxidoreductase [Staphylococcus caprae]
MKNILIFGANGYIGMECLKNLKADMKIGVDVNTNRLDTISTSNFKKFKIDMTNINQYGQIIDFLEKNQIKLDNIIFCQGINYMKNFFDSTIETFNKTMDINLTSVYIALKVMYPYLNTTPSIVVLASQNGVVGHEDRIDYGSSKSALIHLVKNLSLDFAKYSNKDIKINALSPTYIANESNENYFNGMKGKKLINNIPYKKFYK